MYQIIENIELIKNIVNINNIIQKANRIILYHIKIHELLNINDFLYFGITKDYYSDNFVYFDVSRLN